MENILWYTMEEGKPYGEFQDVFDLLTKNVYPNTYNKQQRKSLREKTSRSYFIQGNIFFVYFESI